MIRRHVSAALLVRDGFTGQPIASGSAVLCRLNGQSVRPVFKPGGYLVLTDLEAGQYTFSLSARGFHTETVLFAVERNRILEMDVFLKPDARYGFPPDTARLRLELEGPGGALGGEDFWAGRPASVQLRLAQSVKPGESGPVRLYCSGTPARLPIPGQFLLCDEKQPELVRLREVRNESGELDSAMAFPHARGTGLVPAMRFVSDGEGRAELAFPRGGSAALFCKGRMKYVELRPGTVDLRWTPDETDAGETG